MSSASSSTSCSFLICSLCLLSRASHGGGELAKVGLCVVYLVPSSLAKIKKEAARGENEGTTNTRLKKLKKQKKLSQKEIKRRNNLHKYTLSNKEIYTTCNPLPKSKTSKRSTPSPPARSSTKSPWWSGDRTATSKYRFRQTRNFPLPWVTIVFFRGD